MIDDYRNLRGPAWNEADNPLAEERDAYRDALDEIAFILGDEEADSTPKRISDMTDNHLDQIRYWLSCRHLY